MIIFNIKEYKENHYNYKNVVDILIILRVALTSKSMTQDLYEKMRILGRDKIQNRMENITR